MSAKMVQNEYRAPEPPVDFVIITALPEERDALLSKLPGAQKLDKGERDLLLLPVSKIAQRSRGNVLVMMLAYGTIVRLRKTPDNC